MKRFAQLFLVSFIIQQTGMVYAADSTQWNPNDYQLPEPPSIEATEATFSTQEMLVDTMNSLMSINDQTTDEANDADELNALLKSINIKGLDGTIIQEASSDSAGIQMEMHESGTVQITKQIGSGQKVFIWDIATLQLVSYSKDAAGAISNLQHFNAETTENTQDFQNALKSLNSQLKEAVQNANSGAERTRLTHVQQMIGFFSVADEIAVSVSDSTTFVGPHAIARFRNTYKTITHDFGSHNTVVTTWNADTPETIRVQSWNLYGTSNPDTNPHIDKVFNRQNSSIQWMMELIALDNRLHKAKNSSSDSGVAFEVLADKALNAMDGWVSYEDMAGVPVRFGGSGVSVEYPNYAHYLFFEKANMLVLVGRGGESLDPEQGLAFGVYSRVEVLDFSRKRYSVVQDGNYIVYSFAQNITVNLEGFDQRREQLADDIMIQDASYHQSFNLMSLTYSNSASVQTGYVLLKTGVTDLRRVEKIALNNESETARTTTYFYDKATGKLLVSFIQDWVNQTSSVTIFQTLLDGTTSRKEVHVHKYVDGLADDHISTTYDNNGYLLTLDSSKTGKQVRYIRDANGRILEFTYQAGFDSPLRRWVYIYDINGRPLGYDLYNELGEIINTVRY